MRCAMTLVLPEPAPGQDERRPLLEGDGLSLRGVEVGQVEHGASLLPRSRSSFKALTGRRFSARGGRVVLECPS